jgi:hypothetical protein
MICDNLTDIQLIKLIQTSKTPSILIIEVRNASTIRSDRLPRCSRRQISLGAVESECTAQADRPVARNPIDGVAVASMVHARL